MARRGKDDRRLAGKHRQALEVGTRVLTYIANLELPDARGKGFGGPELDSFLDRVKLKTERFWPELWQSEPDQVPPHVALRRMQKYLQRFWLARDGRERDWHIHRAREYCQRHRIMRETRNLSMRWRKAQTISELNDIALDIDIKTEDLLDEVPPRMSMEDALFDLQRRARIPSRRPLYCPDCTQKKPYFLSEKKGTKYCSPECAQAGLLASKRKSWAANKDKWRER
jgi:hypothetical protein